MSDDDLGFFLDCHERQSPTEPTAEPPPPAAGDIEDFFPEPATTVAIDTTGEQVDATCSTHSCPNEPSGFETPSSSKAPSPTPRSSSATPSTVEPNGTS
jgi:hypothetical protein